MSGMKLPGNFFLVGLMGAGKTTIGRALARATDHVFYDSDHEIEARTGVKIPLIFEVEGEAGFREREAAMIDELSTLKDIVLATGGGAVINPQNRAHLRARGTVIYLRASVDDLYARTMHDRNRPLLQTENPKQRLRELFEVRDPLYREVADLIIDTSRQTVQHLAQQLLHELELKSPHAPR
ncbi:shikimate kinase [Andreprevotia lacus DSM 23236]|jgi:shikimate kinase|uniref:Shikimate kinase n=1 Tax=Andreprevotia lacus DSM 23236 TaxID=1121001 RepID=A0A1W1Y179_9NEIS|nr:shikimate kinase AroK [Andreprevotia lacus]SMC29892.1 shikimate kinase [Andreprevotia lacus DSM 23236]